MGGYGASQVVRLASNLILTRILFPAVFAEMALVNTFMVGLQMFSDVGTGPAIVQSRRGDDPGFLNTAWTIACIRGIAVWLVTWIIARPVASFYGQPLLAWLIPAAGFSAVILGFESTSFHTMRRHLRLGRLTVIDLASQVVATTVTVLLAWADRVIFGPNHPGAVWAMVAGGLVWSLTRMVLSYAILPGIRHRFLLEPAARRSLFEFGRWVFLSSLLTFLAAQSDRLAFGKLIPLELFGVYAVASMLAALPTQIVLRLGSAVIFPAFSRIAGRSDFGSIFARVRFPLHLCGAAVVGVTIASGPFLIRVLYDSRYREAGWMLQYLAAGAWFQIWKPRPGPRSSPRAGSSGPPRETPRS